MNRPPKVQATAAFIDGSGNLKASGPHSALPFNPHRDPEWPLFRISFNDEWHIMQMVEAQEDFGWVATAVADLDAEARASHASPRVGVRR